MMKVQVNGHAFSFSLKLILSQQTSKFVKEGSMR